MTDDISDPTEVEEATLDDISGGPHFRTWDSNYYDSHVVMKVRHDTAKAMIQKVES